MVHKILSRENTTPLIILFVSTLLLICMAFSVLDLLNHIILGIFGANAYILLLLAMTLCLAKIFDYNNKFTTSFTIYLFLIALSILFIIHLALTSQTFDNSFKYCLEYPFSNVTPAGVIFSFILYPIMLLLPLEAVICLFAVLFIIFLCLCIDKQYHHNHLKMQYVGLSTKTIKCEKEKGSKKDTKAQTMRIPNATMEKNKSMPTFISMPLTLNAKIEKEENSRKDDLLTPTPLKTINIKKNVRPQQKKVDSNIYGSIISSDMYKTPHSTITLEQAKEKSEVKPLRPQKFLFTEEDDNNQIIGKPQTLLREKNNPVVDNDFLNVKNNFQINENYENSLSNNVVNDEISDITTNDFLIDDIVNLSDDFMPASIVDEPVISNEEIKKPNDIIETKREISRPKKRTKYVCPPLDLLTTKSSIPSITQEKFEEKARTIEEKFEEFRISVKCVGVTRGPAITRYEFEMPQGVTVNKVLQYSNDISMVLESRKAIRIEAPIPGKNAFGIEVPNDIVDTIGLRDIVDTREFRENSSPLTFALGKDITNKPVLSDIGKLVHTLVAGSTGSGKSVCMNSIIISLLYKASPDDVRIILIDPKFVEFNIYENLPHLLLPKIITEPAQAVNALSWACEEMERRNRIFGQHYVRSIDEYNDMQEVKDGTIDKMYKIVIMVDELADLMLNTRKEIEEKILKLSQKARSSGIHLILATQRPSVDIITGTIKANLPSRIAFSLTNFNDSKTIIDQSGAEKLLGRGDMLYCPRGEEPTRLLGPFISQQEVASIVKFIKENNQCDYDPEIEEAIMVEKTSEIVIGDGADATRDEYYKPILRNLIETQMCSISSIQRRFNIGFNRAARIVDDFVSRGYISKADGTKSRQIFITMEEFLRQYGDKN